MAVKQIATEPLDLASADASGAPLVATDATHVDAATSPAVVASASAPGSSVLASPADHEHEGVHSVYSDANPQLTGDVQLVSGTGIALTQLGNVITVAASSGAVNKVTWADDREKSNVGNVEEILFEWLVNFDDAGSGAPANIQARLTAFVASTPAGVGTFNLYVGAAAKGSTVGGTVRAVITANAAAFAQKSNLGAAWANPGGMQIVQLAAVNSAVGNKNKIQGLSIAIG